MCQTEFFGTTWLVFVDGDCLQRKGGPAPASNQGWPTFPRAVLRGCKASYERQASHMAAPKAGIFAHEPPLSGCVCFRFRRRAPWPSPWSRWSRGRLVVPKDLNSMRSASYFVQWGAHMMLPRLFEAANRVILLLSCILRSGWSPNRQVGT